MSNATKTVEQLPQTSLCRKSAYLLILAAVAVLAATGFGAVLILRTTLSGWMLMLHAAMAPAFAIGLAAVALTWAAQPQSRVARPLFWLMLCSGVVVILSGVLPMTPLCGTGGQHALVSIHLFSAIVLAVGVVLHALSLAFGERRNASDAAS